MQLLMMGTGTFALPTLELLLKSRHEVIGLVTQPDRAVGQQRGSTRLAQQGMKELALLHQIPVFQPENVNTPEGIQRLPAWQPDLLVVAAYGQILSRDILATAKLGGINVHASLLPKYRGAAPIAWAIYHGETKTGVTIIRMTTGLDAGDILAQEAVDILLDETAGALESRLGPLGAKLALDIVEKLADGPVVGQPQDKALVTKAPKLTKEQGLIDWSRSSAAVCNQIRAMSPWPTAYTFLHHSGQPPLRLIVHKAAWSASVHALGQCGDLMAGDGAAIRVVAGDGSAVEILELQPAGKRRMPAVEFLRGRKMHVGDRFGPEMP